MRLVGGSIPGFGVAAVTLAVACLLVPGSAQALTPADPEQARLVFSNAGRIVSINADGSGRTELTDPRRGGAVKVGDVYPEISPDGTRLLFVRSREKADDLYESDLMVAARDGSGARPILKTGLDMETGTETSLLAPTWSSDGSRIYFPEISYTERRMISRVVAIDPDGSGRQVLAEKKVLFKELEEEFEKKTVHVGKFWYFTDVDESPDGSKLLVGSSVLFGYSGLGAKLRLLDPATGSMILLQNSAWSGAWSPDGSRIAFNSERQRLRENCYEMNCSFDSKVYVMNADGAKAHRVTRGKEPGFEGYPSWSPDGMRITFNSDRNYPSGTDSMEIYSVKPDGSCLTWLTNGAPASFMSKWAPGAGSADPGSCGAAGRTPRVAFTPPTKSPQGQPVYWLGGNYKGMLSTYYSGAGLYIDYGDCGFFNRELCIRLPRVVISGENVCRGGLHWALQFGRFRSMEKQRGALVAKSAFGNGRPDELLVGTGTQTLEIQIMKTRFSKDNFKQHRAVFRALRPVGAGRPAARFPDAKLSRRAVRRAAQIDRMVDAGGKLGTRNRPAKRAYLRLHRAIERIGKVKTVQCPGRKGNGAGIPFLGPEMITPVREALSAPETSAEMIARIRARSGSGS